MGKELSHILCADQSSNSLTGAASQGRYHSILKEFPSSYHLGAIAADTYFYAVKLPFESGAPHRFGDRIHGAEGDDTSGPAHEMLKGLRNRPNDPLFGEKAAFLGGFLTHIALDSILHPYVYHVSGDYYAACPVEQREARVRHRLIETWFDLHLLRNSSMNLQACGFMAGIRRNGVRNLELLKFFLEACEKSLSIDPASWRDLKRGYRVQMLLNSAFKSPTAARILRRTDRLMGGRLQSFLALFYPGESCEVPREIIHFDMFRHPVTGNRMQGGFQDLWIQARERSVDFLQSVEKFLFCGEGDDDIRNAIQGYNLCSGLVGVPIRGAVHYQHIPMELLLLHEKKS
jgi:hypothetical protein